MTTRRQFLSGLMATAAVGAIVPSMGDTLSGLGVRRMAATPSTIVITDLPPPFDFATYRAEMMKGIIAEFGEPYAEGFEAQELIRSMYEVTIPHMHTMMAGLEGPITASPEDLDAIYGGGYTNHLRSASLKLEVPDRPIFLPTVD